MFPKSKRWMVFFAVVSVVAMVGLGCFTARRARGDATGALGDALRRARAADSYRFTSDVLQISVPTTTLNNVGRQSSADELHLEGQSNLRDKTLQMRMWLDQGGAADPTSGVAVKMEGGRTYVQESLGGWREQEGLTDSFAPQGDFMGFLTALHDPQAHPPERVGGALLTRYTFRLDSAALAAYIRDQLEAQMRQKGQLVGQMQVDLPREYLEMTGDGELWVGADGLPVRQVLRMQFPEQGGERVYAEISTRYSAFVEPAQAAGLMGLGARLKTRLAVLASPVSVVGTLAILAFWAMLLSRRKWIWRAVSAAVIALMVLNPLLADVRSAQAGREINAEAEAQEQQRMDARQREAILARMAMPSRDPHADPLAAAGPAAAAMNQPVELPGAAAVELPEAAAINQPGAGFSRGAVAAPAPAPLLADDGTDTDSDELTDFQEESIGTDPKYEDSDDDNIKDNVEATGFSMPGTGTWYLDATSDDSNNDGLADGEEFDLDENGAADDTDDNGVPDVFDRDNDGDGVPDRKDLSPFAVLPTPASAGAHFSDGAPLRLNLNNLTAGEPTFVDFQLRPANPKQLEYAYHVVDWPVDAKGAVQDIDGVTFATAPRPEGSAQPTDSDRNGDIKLVPMLELRMPNAANLPPKANREAELGPYGILVSENEQVVYLPLSIVTDEDTGQKVAFSGRMRYLPSGSWPSPHEARLVWLVQVLVDVPCEYGEPQCGEDYYKHNVSKTIQSYYEDWVLTGLNVREDQGARVAAIYEDPALAAANGEGIHQNGVLFGLSYGLEQGFLGARDADDNDQRDLDVDEIARRFNYPRQCGGEECWSLPDTLRVNRYDYETIDEAVKDLAVDKTKAILNQTAIGNAWRGDNSYKPLIMYAQESTSRALGMDTLHGADSPVTWSGGVLAVNFASASRTVNASLKWIPYNGTRAGTDITWAVCDMEEWWTYLEFHNVPDPAEPPDPEEQAEINGSRMQMDLYALNLAQGASRIVELDMQVIPPLAVSDDDSTIFDTIAMIVEAGAEKLSEKVQEIVNNRFMGEFDEPSTWQKFKTWCGDLRSGKLWTDLKTKIGATTWKQRVGFGLLAAAAVTAIAVSAVFYFNGNSMPAKITMGVISLALTVYGMVKPFKAFVDVAKCIGFTKDLLRWRAEVVGNSKRAGVIGAIIAGVVTWALFIAQVCISGAPIFGLAFNQALAQAIADTIYIIIMTALAATLVGLIIVGIIAAIDIIIGIICAAVGAEDSGWCKGISGWITAAIAWSFYSNSPMVDLEKSDLVVPGSPNMSLAQENKGYVAGNAVNISMDVTTNIVHADPPWYDWVKLLAYTWMFSGNNLVSSTFHYSLTAAEQDPGAGRYQMTGEWQDVTVDHYLGWVKMWRAHAHTTANTPSGLALSAGINQPRTFYFNMSYAVPAYECWGVLFLTYCDERDLKDHNSTEIKDLVLDVLPANLDDFMELREVAPVQAEPADQSFALAWDAKFPALADADGDGLLNAGLDPDDSQYDTDNDGLSDMFELEQQQKGKAYNPTICDTDGDDLTDYQEALLGTDPAKSDTDGDGLMDYVEARTPPIPPGLCVSGIEFTGGWNITVPSEGGGSRVFRVYSNPLAPDSDSDSVSDANEKLYAENANPALRIDPFGYPYHPMVKNTPWVGVYGNLSRVAIRPDESVVYTTTVETYTPLDDSNLLVDAMTRSGEWRIFEDYNMDFNPSATMPETAALPLTFDLPADTISQTMPIYGIFTPIYSPPPPGDPPPATFAIQTNLLIDGGAPLSSIDSLANGQFIKGSPDAPVVTIIGGSAWDLVESGPESPDFAGTGIDKVEVRLSSDGAWEEAYGTNTWLYALAIGPEVTNYDICVRSTDGAGNVQAAPTCISGPVDQLPPSVEITSPAAAVIPDRMNDGHWAVPLAGNAFDLAYSPTLDVNGSGVDEPTFEVRLRLDDEANPLVGEWQRPQRTSGSTPTDPFPWTLHYDFPPTLADPTGTWIPEYRAFDMAGNYADAAQMYGPVVVLDSTAPQVEMIQEDAERQELYGSNPLDGSVTDFIGVEKLELSFSPISPPNPLEDALVWLPFDEPANHYYWADHSGNGHFASCDSEMHTTEICVQTGALGRSGGALRVEVVYPDTRSGAVVADSTGMNIAADAGFSAHAWIKTNATIGRIIQKSNVFTLGMGEGPHPYFSVSGTYADDMEIALDDEQWHQMVGTLDRATNQISLYVDGVLRNSAPIPAGQAYTSPEPLMIYESYYENMQAYIDEVAVFDRTLSADEVMALYQIINRQQYPVTLAQHGSGVSQANWTFPLPPNLEGLYEVDLRAWDALGNHAVSPLWRGVVDTTAPRVELTAQGSAAALPSYRPDAAKPGWMVAADYTCSAQDMFLKEDTFECPGANLPPPMRAFVDDPALLELFPGLALVNELSLAWTQWQPAGAYPASMRACDRWGNCAQKSITPNISAFTHPGPVAVITSPADGAVVDGSSVEVTIYAFADNESAPAWLKNVVLKRDGATVHTKTFAENTVSDANYKVNVAVTPGAHTLSVTAEEWGGAVQSVTSSIEITVDPNPPQVAISTAKITEADRYMKGSSALIFRGTASDTECLASVMFSVNNGPFEAAVYDEALHTWELAYYVNAPEGKTLAARARATDCGGLTTEVSKNIPTELTLPPAQAPDTRIDSRPPDPGYPDNATFTFTGLKHEKEIAGLTCQLDDGVYEPCISPLTYTGISHGQHTFRVRAVDVEGNVDPTPPSHTWTVVAKPFWTWMPWISNRSVP